MQQNRKHPLPFAFRSTKQLVMEIRIALEGCGIKGMITPPIKAIKSTKFMLEYTDEFYHDHPKEIHKVQIYKWDFERYADAGGAVYMCTVDPITDHNDWVRPPGSIKFIFSLMTFQEHAAKGAIWPCPDDE